MVEIRCEVGTGVLCGRVLVVLRYGIEVEVFVACREVSLCLGRHRRERLGG